MLLAALPLTIDARALETLVDRTVAAEMQKQQIPGAACGRRCASWITLREKLKT